MTPQQIKNILNAHGFTCRILKGQAFGVMPYLQHGKSGNDITNLTGSSYSAILEWLGY